METKLKKSSWHKRLYEFWWRKSAPSNLCNYFWGLVIAIITIPFFIAGRSVYGLFVNNPDTNEESVFIRSIIYAFNTFCTLLFAIVLGYIIGLSFYYPWDAFAVFGLLTFLVVFIIGSFYFAETETFEITSNYISAKKQKLCPQINWID